MKNIIAIIVLLLCITNVNAQVALSDIRDLQKEYEKLGINVDVEHINDMKYIERYQFYLTKLDTDLEKYGVNKELNERKIQEAQNSNNVGLSYLANHDKLEKLTVSAINKIQKKATDVNRWEYHKNGHDTINCVMTFAKDKPKESIDASKYKFWWDVYDIPEYLVAYQYDLDTVLFDWKNTDISFRYKGRGNLVYVCTLDSAKRGTQALNVDEYLKYVDKAFGCEGVEKYPVVYEHTGDMFPDAHQLMMQVFPDRPKLSKSVGTVYRMKDRSVADKVVKEVEKYTKTYFDAHPETRYTYVSNMSFDEQHLYNIFCDMGNVNGVHAQFRMFMTAPPSDDYYIMFLHTIGEEWIPNDLTINSYKNGKIKYYDKAK